MAVYRAVGALLIVVPLCAGCLAPFVLPVPPLGYVTEGKPIGTESIAFIDTGVTTKADVVWELGAPDESGMESPIGEAAFGEDWVSYTGSRHRGEVLAGVANQGGSAGFGRVCRRPWSLKIWFDESGVVTRHELRDGETRCEWRGVVWDELRRSFR